jgi:two-component system chemotaxis response regulator CheY
VLILVVDDSRTYRELLTETIREFGHDYETAEDGLQGWERFRSGGADVIVSDWMMPGLEGVEFCRRVRQETGRPYTYFILLTALEDKRHLVEAMEAGADDYLNKPFDREDLRARLIAASRVTSLHRRLARQQSELENLNRELHDQARRDPLTGVGNRLRLREDLDALAGRVERYEHRYSIALCDIDEFKRYNDSQGHTAGDTVLRTVAEALVSVSRRGDVVYRFGGEEFLILFPEQELSSAVLAAERMRRQIEALGLPHPASQLASVVTLSIGVAQLEPGDTPDTVLHRADEALYRAKETGRNRVNAEAGGRA